MTEPQRGAASVARRLWTELILPFGPGVYAAIMLAIGDLRVEHIAIAVGTAALGYVSRTTRAMLAAVAPGLLVILGYDVMRYVRPIFVVPERVIGCGMRDFDLRLFRVAPDTTPADYFATHHIPALDLFFAIPYSIFIGIALGYCVYLYFNDRPRLSYYLWSFALVHAMAFIVWLALPVAPPWYIETHGCTIVAGTVSNAAGLLRVDHLLGIHYFRDFYARSPDVFGAMPSLHCAFPAIGLLTAWRATGWRTRPLHVLYTLWMFAASVYLGHHWVVDGLVAWLMAAAAVAIVGRIMRPPR